LVPLVDTFNHDPETKVRFITDLSKNVFRYQCDYNLQAGSEVRGVGSSLERAEFFGEDRGRDRGRDRTRDRRQGRGERRRQGVGEGVMRTRRGVSD
jgi:hypothetical protein